VDALICDNVHDFTTLFRDLPNAKASFATKFVNREMLGFDPQRKTRIRFSLMPQSVARVVDVRTSPISERIAAINDFYDAGYEVHLNFSPVIFYQGWLDDYRALFTELADVLSPGVKAQLAAEIIFLTHNDKLHENDTGSRARPAWSETLRRAGAAIERGPQVAAEFTKGFKPPSPALAICL
jgi:spore photoproduct lyase